VGGTPVTSAALHVELFQRQSVVDVEVLVFPFTVVLRLDVLTMWSAPSYVVVTVPFTAVVPVHLSE